MSRVESEGELVRRAAAGDRASLSQLLLLHYDDLRRHIEGRMSRHLQGLVRSDDILQQVFVRAAQSIASFEFRHDGALRGWLRTIAENLVRDAEKRRYRERAVSAVQPDSRQAGDSGAPAAGIEQLAAAISSPSHRVQRLESIRRMRSAIDRLPEDQREVVRRRYLDGQSLGEIAAATGTTKEAVRGLCYRARKNLRVHMGRTSLYFSN